MFLGIKTPEKNKIQNNPQLQICVSIFKRTSFICCLYFSNHFGHKHQNNILIMNWVKLISSLFFLDIWFQWIACKFKHFLLSMLFITQLVAYQQVFSLCACKRFRRSNKRIYFEKHFQLKVFVIVIICLFHWILLKLLWCIRNVVERISHW